MVRSTKFGCFSSPGSLLLEVEHVSSEVCLGERGDAERSGEGASAVVPKGPKYLTGPSRDRTGKDKEIEFSASEFSAIENSESPGMKFRSISRS